MWVLQLLFLLTVLSIINCFQWAAGILAKQIGRSFWRWFLIAQFLPIVSLIILICLWQTNTDQPPKVLN